jgi:hypothetical protein
MAEHRESFVGLIVLHFEHSTTALKEILKSDLSSDDVKKLFTFSLQCGADTFAMVSPNENPFQKVFKSYYIGTKKSEAPCPPE